MRVGVEDTCEELVRATPESLDAFAPYAGPGRVGILGGVADRRCCGRKLDTKQCGVTKDVELMRRCAGILRLEPTRTIHMGENTEAAESLEFVQAVKHAIAAMRVLRTSVTDVDLTVKALQGFDRR